MRIRVRTKDIRLFIPIPDAMVGFAARFIPERAFEEMRAGTPEPYRSLVTKENISMLLGECLEIIKENKGLEVIHVETADGTFVSIKL